MASSDTSRIDFRQVRAIVYLGMTHAFRKNIDPTTGRGKSPLAQLILSLGIFGIFQATTTDQYADLRSYLIVVFLNVFGIVCLSLLTDTGDLRQRIVEIIHTKPVSERTLALARAVETTIVAALISLCYALMPLAATVWAFACPPLVAGLILVLLVAGMTVTLIVWSALVTVAASRMGVARLRKASQSVLILVLLGPVFLTLRGMLRANVDSPLVTAKIDIGSVVWFKLLPPTWYADFAVIEPGYWATFERCAAAGLALAAFIVLTRFNYDGYLSEFVEKLGQTETTQVTTATSLRWLNALRAIPGLGKRLIPDQTYGVAALVLTASKREDTSRAKMLVQRILLVAFVGLGSVWMKSSIVIPLVMYYGFVYLAEGVELSKQSTQSTASWLFPHAPLEGRHILRGMRLAAVTRYFLLPGAIVAVLYPVAYPPLAAAVLVPAFFIEAHLIVSLMLAVRPALPLAQDVKSARFFLSAAIGIVVGVAFNAVHFGIARLLGGTGGQTFRFAIGGGFLAALLTAATGLHFLAAYRLSRLEHLDAPPTAARKFFKRLACAAAAVLAIPVLFFVNEFFIPPWGGKPAAPPVAAPPPPETNAWTYLESAGAALGDPKKPEYVRDFEKLEQYLDPESALPPEVNGLLGKYAPAVGYIELAADKPSFAFTDPVNPPQDEPDETAAFARSTLIHNLTVLALAEAKRRHSLAEDDAAARLYVAAYAMNLRFAVATERTGDLFFSSGFPRRATAALFAFLAEDRLEEEPLRDIALRIAAVNREIPRPTDLVDWKIAGRLREMTEPSEKTKKKFGMNPFKGLPNFSKRIGAYLAEISNAHRERLRPVLESGCVNDYDQARNRLSRTGRWYLQSPSRSIAGLYAETTIPQSFEVATNYLDRTDGQALVIVAALLAYRQKWGSFPERLETALTEIGIPAIRDPLTGKPVGYRFDRETPVFWFAGYDGRDDGGQKSQRFFQIPSTDNSDLVYRPWEIPGHYIKQNFTDTGDEEP